MNNKELEEAINYQINTFPIYNEILRENSLTAKDIKKIIENREYWKIPPVDALTFKSSRGLYLELANTELDGLFHCSSSTSGDPSLVYLSNSDLEYKINNVAECLNIEECDTGIAFLLPLKFSKIVRKKMKKRFEEIENYKFLPVMFFAPMALERIYENLEYGITGIDFFKTIKNYISGSKQPALKFLSIEKIIKKIEEYKEKDKPLAMGGFILLFYPTIKGIKNKLSDSIDFDKIYIITGAGGWSGKKGTFVGKSIDKKNFVKEMAELFNIKEKDIPLHFIDAYACTESPVAHRGFFDLDVGDYVFHPHKDSLVYIINKETGKPVDEGEEGLIRIITFKKQEGAPTVVIQQHDVARLLKKGEYNEALEFTNIHREKGYKSEGCALGASELMGVKE